MIFIGAMFYSLPSVLVAFLVGALIAAKWMKRPLKTKNKAIIFFIAWIVIGGFSPLLLGREGLLATQASFLSTIVVTLSIASRGKSAAAKEEQIDLRHEIK